MDLIALNALEEDLLDRFRRHPIWHLLREAPDNAVRKLMLQDRFQSLAFTPLCDQVLDGLCDPEARDVVRWLIQEEYPQRGATHRENLLLDLEAIGISPATVLETQPALATVTLLSRLFTLLAQPMPPDRREVQSLSLLRTWGEVLTAEEFALLIPRLGRLGLHQNQSRFFVPHAEHDRKRQPLHHSPAPGSHADSLARVLVRACQTAEHVSAAAKVLVDVCRWKSEFYDGMIEWMKV